MSAPNGPAARRPPLLAAALRQALGEGYAPRHARADVLAGLTVGVVALPLAMALAIASGAPPRAGLATAIVGGAVIALLGGSRLSVSGPTAAFVALLAPIATRHGAGGLALATALAGLVLVLLGVLRLGRMIQYIPHPVTAGFTAGIAVVIASLQVKDLLGLPASAAADHMGARLATLARALPALRLPDALMGAGTLALLVGWPRLTRRVPAALVALALAGCAAWVVHAVAPQWDVATIGTRFRTTVDGVVQAGIPRAPPAFAPPWTLPGADGSPLTVDWDLLRALLPSALAIALLGAIESLLCAVVADGMVGTKHDPDAELLAQGLGNVLCPFFGGLAATGAVARTATNVRAGGRSPIAAVVHAAFVLAAVLLLAPALSWLPMASLAALLLVVAVQMSDLPHVARVLRVGPRSDGVVLVTCLALTVAFDMVVAVSVGVVLAALLFMRRMAELARVDLAPESRRRSLALPPDVLLYEIGGPLFFGAAEKAVGALARGPGGARAAILDLEDVPAMDLTGLVALESVLGRLERQGTCVVIAGARRQPRSVLRRAGIAPRAGTLAFARDVEQALELLRAGEGGATAGASPTADRS
jgi:SulP family sulfate permease